jgi:hypothetical protein
MLHISTKLEPDHQMMHMFGLGDWVLPLPGLIHTQQTLLPDIPEGHYAAAMVT